jgi:CheY-like chemotaxis protein
LASNVTILVAVEDEGHLTIVKKNLRRAGVANEIIQFNSGDEILNFMFSKGPEPHRNRKTDFLLILDTKIPKTDGIEVLRQIKQDDEIQKIPVIMLTTTEDHEEMVQCHILGCSDYLKKPVDFRVLEKTVKEAGLFKMS